ncbi:MULTISPECIES: spore cortex biosynthesis protein YabQ [Clostridium]|uniref:Spore cortex biosynthesis protein YabQ n=1 Tax=Clostridium cibarium TaxID=2762247 RepID=A0ABR8PS49_9CLOT|nr:MULTISPECIES: spore cortex biosynthesis protein YabQ [Clostridium]MBD7910972.1 spore cortex biosynthesis protein YabQ [Clostridium cibarium]
MPLKLDVQLDIVIYSLIAGVITGILFDAYRLIRGLKVPKLLIVIEDVLFWAFCTLVVFSFLLYTNYAFLGPYVYLFIFISLIIYFKLVSHYVIYIEKIIAKGIIKFFRVMFKNLVYPFKIFLSRMGNKNS